MLSINYVHCDFVYNNFIYISYSRYLFCVHFYDILLCLNPYSRYECILTKSFQLLKIMWIVAVEQSLQLHDIQVLSIFLLVNPYPQNFDHMVEK